MGKHSSDSDFDDENIQRLSIAVVPEFKRPDPQPSSLPLEDETLVTDPYELTELFAEKLLLGEPQDWSDAFHLLVSSIGGRGGEVGMIGPEAFLGTTGDPKIVLSCGEYCRTSHREEIIKYFYSSWGQRNSASKCAVTILPGEPSFACCALPYSKNQILGIVVWGDFSTDDRELLILQSFTRLLANVLRRRGEFSESRFHGHQQLKNFPDGYVAGCSDVINCLHGEVEILSKADFPVLLLGETGVGKEHVAQLLHQWSPRKNGPFVVVNCAAIPNELMEAEMFGIGRGVASGVVEREGYFQMADGGTLFLDEVGELQLFLQAKLLRALQGKEVRPVGGATVKPNIRIVSATNADLRKRMEEGTFRTDLYYRIAGFELIVPPLRERKGDIPLLVEHFLRRFSAEAGKKFPGITLKALELINEYRWPGNVREFEYEMRRAVYLCPEGEPISTEHLSVRLASSGFDSHSEDELATDFSLEKATDKLERLLIRQALIKTDGNRTQAAKLLGITRNGLAIKMERLGLKR